MIRPTLCAPSMPLIQRALTLFAKRSGTMICLPRNLFFPDIENYISIYSSLVSLVNITRNPEDTAETLLPNYIPLEHSSRYRNSWLTINLYFCLILYLCYISPKPVPILLLYLLSPTVLINNPSRNQCPEKLVSSNKSRFHYLYDRLPYISPPI